MFTLKLKITRNLGLASLRKGQWIVKDMWRWFRNACPAEVQPASHHHSSRRLWDQGSSSAGDFARSWVLKAQRRRNWMPTKEQSTKMEALEILPLGECPAATGAGARSDQAPRTTCAAASPSLGGKGFSDMHSESPSFTFPSVVSGPSLWPEGVQGAPVPLSPSEPALLLQPSPQGSCSSPSAFGALWFMVVPVLEGTELGNVQVRFSEC